MKKTKKLRNKILEIHEKPFLNAYMMIEKKIKIFRKIMDITLEFDVFYVFSHVQ